MNSTLIYIDDKEINLEYLKHHNKSIDSYNDRHEITIISHKKYLVFQNKR